MARLYLHCAVCSRKQADGLLSGARWGRLDVPNGSTTDHPALQGATLRACPTCVERHPDWQQSLLRTLGLSAQ